MKSRNVIERIEKVESDMIVNKYVMRKEVKSTNEEETRKKISLIFRCGECKGCVWKDGCRSEL